VIMIKANDTVALVIAVNVLPDLKEIGVKQLWVDFGQGLNRRRIRVQDICLSIILKTHGILFFLAFSGCDVVSFLPW